MPKNKRRIKSYIEKLQDRRWQQRRLEILEAANWKCFYNPDHQGRLDVHHRYYDAGKNPWDYPDEALVALCSQCHEAEEDRLYWIRYAVGMGGRDLQEKVLEFLKDFQPPVIQEPQDSPAEDVEQDNLAEARSGFSAIRAIHEKAAVGIVHSPPWSDVLIEFSKRQPLHAGWAAEAIFEGFANGLFTIRFPEEYLMAKLNTERPKVFQMLTESLEKVVGPGVTLQIL